MGETGEEADGRRAARHRSVRTAAAAVVLAVTLAAGGAVGYCVVRTGAAQADEARWLKVCEDARSLADETEARARTLLDGDGDGTAAVDAGRVADPATLDALRTALDDMDAALSRKPADAPGGSWESPEAVARWFAFDAPERARDEAKDARRGLSAARGKLADAVAAVESSMRRKDVEDARTALAQAVTDAESSLESLRDEVSDADAQTALEQELDAARAVRDADISGLSYLSQGDCQVQVSDYRKESGSLSAARERAENSHADWQAARRREAEYASRQAAERAAARTGGTASQRSDGTWYVSYRGTDDRSSANADGSMSKWADGYYIAHSWSANGKKIASKPSTVVVDGKTYRYVSSITVPRSTTWDQVSGFVHQNGGIGFQTCSGADYLITHYEPVQ